MAEEEAADRAEDRRVACPGAVWVASAAVRARLVRRPWLAVDEAGKRPVVAAPSRAAARGH